MDDPGLLLTLSMALSVFIGAVSQRANGMGFALLSAPFLVLVLGPLQGMLAVNAASVLANSLILVQVWRDVDWPRAKLLVPMGVVGVLPGAVAVELLPEAPLTIVVSLLVVLGLGVTNLLRGRTVPPSAVLGAAGGFTSGFMGVTAGVAGPGVVVYARATGWEHRHFAATAQLHGVALGIVSLAAKRALPSFEPSGWIALLVSLLVGLLVGDRLSRRIDGAAAMRVVVLIAMAGALLALGRGMFAAL
ncbi:sulfite exporter TauE/SafE family protein [Brachybacterium sp. 107]|uniref:sulfite exporter TauE/SafE family protein n=1 Tax=Brachybacterium sp. 107 TaxID=3457736 RepID=UPI0040334D69